MADEVTIRRAVLKDAQDIANSNVRMAWETESLQLDPDKVAKGVHTMLVSADKGFYVVAEVGGVFAGCLLVTSEWSDWNNGEYWWFQSVFVVPEYRKRKIFTGLFQYVENLATEGGNVAKLRLYVERTNKVAQATYNKLGMELSHYDLFEKSVTPAHKSS